MIRCNAQCLATTSAADLYPTFRSRTAPPHPVAKDTLGNKLVILGHHYQQDAIIDFADFTGDSFELSRYAANQKNIQYVIFCGVHFMAESADILTPDPSTSSSPT